VPNTEKEAWLEKSLAKAALEKEAIAYLKRRFSAQLLYRLVACVEVVYERCAVQKSAARRKSLPAACTDGGIVCLSSSSRLAPFCTTS
jgi:hypothetical protein